MAIGDNGMKEYNARVSRKSSAAKSDGPSQQLKEHFRIYFPADQTVAKSRGGREVSTWWIPPPPTHRDGRWTGGPVVAMAAAD